MARGTKWEEVAENLNKIQQVYFKVDKRAVRDRCNLLSKDLRNKFKREEKESGIETDMTVEMALEELIEKENVSDTEQRVVENQKKVKESEDWLLFFFFGRGSIMNHRLTYRPVHICNHTIGRGK